MSKSITAKLHGTNDVIRVKIVSALRNKVTVQFLSRTLSLNTGLCVKRFLSLTDTEVVQETHTHGNVGSVCAIHTSSLHCVIA